MGAICKYSSVASCRLLSRRLQTLPRLPFPRRLSLPRGSRSGVSFCTVAICWCVCVQMFCVSSELNWTGKPFIHPDGSAVVYNPASAAGRIQHGKTPQQQQPIPAATQQQQQPANHLHSQVSGRGHTSSLFTNSN